MDQQPTPEQKPERPHTPEPVAYDAQGRPLYAAPPTQNPNPQTAPQFVHFSRAVEPVEQEVPAAVKARHEQSVKDFPFLNLSEAEFVISAVRRHPIGLVAPIGLTLLAIAFIVACLANLRAIAESLGLYDLNYGATYLLGGLLVLLIAVFGYISVWIYRSNKFFLTNESVIQEIQTSLFSRMEQTVSLVNIEDASFTQTGIFQNMFDYGAIRLSTEGDETTYRFTYVANPKGEIATLNNAVEAFKNGRPVMND